jgi:two-component system, response regulator
MKTVLLVEDNDNDIFLTRRALSKLTVPHHLVIAQDGVEALAYLFPEEGGKTVRRPDLLLIDLRLPLIDGLQVIQTVRSNSLTRDLPIVVMSSSSEETDSSGSAGCGRLLCEAHKCPRVSWHDSECCKRLS